MELQEFRKELIEDVRSTAAAYGEGSSAAFVGIFSNYLVNAEVLPDFEATFYLGQACVTERYGSMAMLWTNLIIR